MADRKLPRAYAQALLETASENWLGTIKKVAAEIKRDGSWEALDDPATPFTDKEKAIAKLLPKGTSEQARNFLLLLAKENRIASLGEIIAEFEDLVRYGPEVRLAEVISAVPITLEEQAAIQEKLSRRFAGTLAYRFTVDPEILGGLIVRVEDKVIDGSLAGKLQALREKLLSG